MRLLKRLMRRIKPSSSKRKPVHFVFHSHGEGEPFPRKKPATGISVGILENALGSERHESIDELGIDAHEKYDNYLQNARTRGIRIVGGEQFRRRRLSALRVLQKESMNAFYAAEEHPTLENIKRYFRLEARMNRTRHRSIIATIKRESRKGAVEATYGTMHSTLVQELRKQGIPARRTRIGTQQFDKMKTIIRQLTLNPRARISDEAYYKGFLSAGVIEVLHTRFNRMPFTDPYYRMINTLTNTIVDGLTTAQLRSFLKNGQGLEKKIQQIIRGNSIEKYLERHSPIWKRLGPEQKRAWLEAIGIK